MMVQAADLVWKLFEVTSDSQSSIEQLLCIQYQLRPITGASSESTTAFYGEISETLKNLEFYSAFKFQDDVVDAHIGFINNRIQKNSGAFQGA